MLQASEGITKGSMIVRRFLIGSRYASVRGRKKERKKEK